MILGQFFVNLDDFGEFGEKFGGSLRGKGGDIETHIQTSL